MCLAPRDVRTATQTLRRQRKARRLTNTGHSLVHATVKDKRGNSYTQWLWYGCAYTHGPVYRSMLIPLSNTEFRSCVRVEVAVLGCPS